MLNKGRNQGTYDLDRVLLKKVLNRYRFLHQIDVDLVKYVLKKPRGSRLCYKHYLALRRIQREAGFNPRGVALW